MLNASNKNINILGHKYIIKEDKLMTRDEANGGGCCNFNKCEITLDPTISPTRYEETFLHEIFEAINWHLQIGLEHHQLTALSEALYSVVKNNNMKIG